jgi:Tfp pilus assembly protein PilF
MYVILAILALLLSVLACCVVRLKATARTTRKHEAVAARLSAALALAEAERRELEAAAEASDAITAVLPAIRIDDQSPRRVA